MTADARTRGKPRVCVVGAGMAGLAACRALQSRELPFVCYELSDRVGGLWVYGEDRARSAAYRSLHVNSSKQGTAFSEFPMPDHYPTYPSHTQVADYLQAYADHFKLTASIRFGSEVQRAERLSTGGWRVTVNGAAPEHFDALMVCNGHHWKPRLPEPLGTFTGRTLHSHDYKHGRSFADQNVVVVGMGNSALDIACDLKDTARRVLLSHRRGAWIAPKSLYGIPADQLIPKLFKLPLAKYLLTRDRLEWLITTLVRIGVGPMQRYGLPEPSQGLFQSHISVHSYIFGALMDGSVVPKPGLRMLAGDSVEFEDGSTERVDAIIYCTGYQVSFPFFDASVFARDEAPPLFWSVFSADVPDVFFIGLVDAQGSIHPLAEMQSKLVASHLVGEYALPEPAEMRAHSTWVAEYRRNTWIHTARHSLEWHVFEYVQGLKAEIGKGIERARQNGSAAGARGTPQ